MGRSIVDALTFSWTAFISRRLRCGGGDRSLAPCGDAQEAIFLSAGAALGVQSGGAPCGSASGVEPLLQPLDDGTAHLQTSRRFSHGCTIVQSCQGSVTVQDAQFTSCWHAYSKPDSGDLTHQTRIKNEKCSHYA